MKNFQPRGNRTRTARLKTDVQVHPFSACCVSVVDDINVNLVFRSLCNFAGLELFVIGSDKWHKGATNGLRDIVRVRHFSSVNAFLSFVQKTDYSLVAIEQSQKSVPLSTFLHPKKPCFIFGNESYGLGDDVLLHTQDVVEIEMEGFHPSLNIGCAASITFYDFVTKYGNMRNE